MTERIGIIGRNTVSRFAAGTLIIDGAEFQVGEIFVVLLGDEFVSDVHDHFRKLDAKLASTTRTGKVKLGKGPRGKWGALK